METPSSTRRAARSQPSQKEAISRPRALLDITNDSPIMGLASGAVKTPSSLITKDHVQAKQTPGTNETLLRGQVKDLLEMVDEKAVLVKMPPFADRRPLREMMGIQISPGQLLAPTPANTPQIATDDHPVIPPQVSEGLKQEEPIVECLMNRALMFDDSPVKSEISDTSTITYQASGISEKSFSDDSSSWSLQVNTSIQEEEEEERVENCEEEVYEEDDECYDDLCDVLDKMTVKDEARLPEFKGKHTRFVYNNDGEIERCDEDDEKVVSPGVIVLKGLPVPEGKHLRFPEEE